MLYNYKINHNIFHKRRSITKFVKKNIHKNKKEGLKKE